ncbi:MAG: GDSL-type esterase/lipase family protein, partial [Pygmaiobacter sp.]
MDYIEVIDRLPPKKKRQFLLFVIGCLAAIILVIVLFASLLAKGKSHEIPLSGSIPSDISASTPAADQNYNKDADKLEQSKYKETILPEGTDAGQDYIDETLFIGDSNTARMMSYGFASLDNAIGTVSMGIQDIIGKNCVFFKGYENGVTVPQAVKLMQPRRIIITFGTNNTIGWDTKTFIEQYKQALKKIVAAYPSVDIIINAIPPVHQYRDNPNIKMQTIDSFNKALVTMAQEEGYKFLNSSEVLKDDKTGFAKWDYTISDGIHLNKDAMTALFTYFRTHSYVTPDDRPALAKIPGRLETPYDIITKDPLAIHAEKDSSSDTKKDYTVTFSVKDTAAGQLEGIATQQLALGESTTKVKAIPLKGYVFDHWTINVGSIDDKNPELIFNLKLNTEKKISIVA